MTTAFGNLRESRGELNHQLKTIEGDIELAKKVDPNLKFTILEDRKELEIDKFEEFGIPSNKRRCSLNE